MTLRCNVCDGPVKIVDDNGAKYPQTRIEHYECEVCGHKQTEVLTA